MQLKDVDLNLLVTFQQLLDERSVSRAAAKLGLGQPAVSNALARLRTLFGDELFTRTPQGMLPTPKAQQLAEPIAQALLLLHGALNTQLSFDPATSARNFTLGLTDIGDIYFLPRLMEQLQTVAPHVTVSTVRDHTLHLKDALAGGQVDMAMGLLPQLTSGFFQRRLFAQRYVCIFRQGHAIDGTTLSQEDFYAQEHVAIVSAGTGHGQVDALLDQHAPARRIKLRVPHFLAVGPLLQSTRLIATVPERLAERLAGPFGLRYLPHPVPLPAIDISLFWHAKQHKDPAIQWLRRLVIALHADYADLPDSQQRL